MPNGIMARITVLSVSFFGLLAGPNKLPKSGSIKHPSIAGSVARNIFWPER